MPWSRHADDGDQLVVIGKGRTRPSVNSGLLCPNLQVGRCYTPLDVSSVRVRNLIVVDCRRVFLELELIAFRNSRRAEGISRTRQRTPPGRVDQRLANRDRDARESAEESCMFKSTKGMRLIAGAVVAFFGGFSTPAWATYGGAPAIAAHAAGRDREPVQGGGPRPPGGDRLPDRLRDRLRQRTDDGHGDALSHGLQDGELHRHEARDRDQSMSTGRTR